MRNNLDRNWEALGQALAAESTGKSPRLFSSRKTLFGIPSALDQELAEFERQNGIPVCRGESVAAEKDAASDAGNGWDDNADLRSDVGKNEKTAGKSKRKKANATRVSHPLEPVFDENSRVLILGTMPSPKSRETGFYYNHPQNRFWKVMAALFDAPLPQSNQEKRELVLAHGIALWDVLAECTIEGASDGTIAECVPNDIGRILAKAPIEAIFCTGAKATELYRKYCEARTGMDCTHLPSTSPANASASLEDLVEAYRQILPFVSL